MSIIRFALERYQFTALILMLATLLGLMSFLSMPRSEDPQFNFAAATVIVVYPGATPLDVEQLVVDPLEEAINELDDINKIESTIRNGVSVTYVEFLQGTDADDAVDDVTKAANNAERLMPAEVAEVRVRKQSPTDVNIVQFALVSETATYATLRRQSERLEKELERVSGVMRSETWGFPDEQIEVALDFDRIKETGVSFGQVFAAVSGDGQNIPGGDLDFGRNRYNVKTSGDFESIEQIAATPVVGTGTESLRVRDLADVSFGYADDSHRARYNGAKAVFVTAVQRKGTNIFDVAGEIRGTAAQFADRLPDDVQLETVFDQSESVGTRIGGFFSNLGQGVFLVGLVVILVLGFRASFIVMISIPISLLIALGWLDYAGYGLQQMSIVGLVIALGLLVDNAIVVTENIARYRKQGLSAKDAAMKGTQQVAWPIVSSTVTTVLAFIPMVVLKTGTGDFIRSMPLTVVFALIASLLVSLMLTPLLTSKLGRRDAPEETPEDAALETPAGASSSDDTRQAARASSRARRRPLLAGLLDKAVDSTYRGTLATALRRPVLVLATATAIFVGTLALFPLVGVSLFPKAEKPQLLVNVDLPEGASLDRTDAVALQVEQLLMADPSVASVATNVGHGNPRVYYNAFPKNETTTHAQLFVQIADNDIEATSDLLHRMQPQLDAIPGARIEIKEFLQGPPVTAPIEISVVGDDLDVIRREAQRVEQIITGMPGTIDIDNPSTRFTTDMRVAVNREKAGLLGVGLSSVDQSVRAGLAGIVATSFRDRDGEDYDVVLTMPDEGRPGVDQFDRMHVTSRMGAAVPLRQVAQVEFESSPSLIEHLGLERAATVTADVGEGYNIAATTAAVLAELEQIELPPGYRYQIGGEEESRNESFGGMGQALLIALLGIFAVLVLQFRSLRQPLIVFAAIPFAITGAILALLVTGYTFSFTAFIGLTSLVGIVVNNSIILVDYANQLREQGRTVMEAIQQAGETRFVPIVLTTLTTIGGLTPLALTGSTMWAPMAWAIIGGLAVSTFLTLVVVPVLYKLLTPDSSRLTVTQCQLAQQFEATRRTPPRIASLTQQSRAGRGRAPGNPGRRPPFLRGPCSRGRSASARATDAPAAPRCGRSR